MAIQKSKDHPSGVSINYWKVERLVLDKRSKSAEIFLMGYIGKPNDSIKLPIEDILFSISGEDFDEFFPVGDNNNAFRKSYLYLKSLPEFSDGSDV